MWGRKEDQSNGAETLASASRASARPSEAPPRPPAAPAKPAAPSPATPSAGTSRIGQSISFKGEIHSDEDFLVDGAVDGSISVPKHAVVIGSESKVRATIEAHSVLIRGHVEGKINASEKVEISNTGRFKGDLITRRLEIHDGAVFVGSSSVHQAKPAPAPPPEKKAEAELKPPAPPAKPASALQPAPPPAKKPEQKPPASPAAPAPLKPAPAVKPASSNPVPTPAIPQRPLTKP
ncbi:MAG: polymer-forming cytoskeletal protein [Acidobacteriia bacterium]|nr:polymer-forming cytoskeletal protein [Terriglobia bacterium]